MPSDNTVDSWCGLVWQGMVGSGGVRQGGPSPLLWRWGLTNLRRGWVWPGLVGRGWARFGAVWFGTINSRSVHAEAGIQQSQ